MIRIPVAISIKERHVFSFGRFHSRVSGMRSASIFLGNDVNSGILKKFHHLKGAIRRAVINDDQFKILKFLIQYGLNGFSQIMLQIIGD
nr:hypothetical protein [Akkermansia massiliensis]